MGHHHEHHHHEDSKNISVAFFLNLGFTLIEIVGGLCTNSVAILSDALHDLGDSLSLGLAWYFQKLSKKEEDQTFNYGYQRFSVLGAMINAIILIVGSVVILREAVPRLLNPEAANTTGMIGLALLGILVNGAAVLRLTKGRSLNMQVIRLHLLEDVLGWAAVLIGAILMYFFDLPIIDPLLSILIAGYILFNVFKSLKAALKIILQAVPSQMNQHQLEKELRTTVPEIIALHDIKIWTLDGTHHVLTLHAVLEKAPIRSEVEIKKRIRKYLHDTYEIKYCTIEIERFEESGAAPP